MPYQELPVSSIVIPIDDLVKGETRIKREAELFDMQYNPTQKRVTLQWIVKHYAATAENTKGEYLSIIADYTKATTADNETMCDSTTGVPIEKIDIGEGVMDYDPLITYTGQYDFFYYMAENQPILVNQLIRQFGVMVTDWNKK